MLSSVVAVLLCSCAHPQGDPDQAYATYSPTPSSIEISTLEKVTLELRNISIENQIITIRLKNERSQPVGYYQYNWALEQWQNGAWYRANYVTEELSAPGITSHPLESMEQKEIVLSWGQLYGRLQTGTYRLFFAIYDDLGGEYFIGTQFEIVDE